MDQRKWIVPDQWKNQHLNSEAKSSIDAEKTGEDPEDPLGAELHPAQAEVVENENNSQPKDEEGDSGAVEKGVNVEDIDENQLLKNFSSNSNKKSKGSKTRFKKSKKKKKPENNKSKSPLRMRKITEESLPDIEEERAYRSEDIQKRWEEMELNSLPAQASVNRDDLSSQKIVDYENESEMTENSSQVRKIELGHHKKSTKSLKLNPSYNEGGNSKKHARNISDFNLNEENLQRDPEPENAEEVNSQKNYQSFSATPEDQPQSPDKKPLRDVGGRTYSHHPSAYESPDPRRRGRKMESVSISTPNSERLVDVSDLTEQEVLEESSRKLRTVDSQKIFHLLSPEASDKNVSKKKKKDKNQSEADDNVTHKSQIYYESLVSHSECSFFD